LIHVAGLAALLCRFESWQSPHALTQMIFLQHYIDCKTTQNA